MCIIAIKPEGIDMPSKKTLKTCWESNPDGAGYMFVQDNKVVIEKGFMTFKSFYKSLRADKLTKEEPVILHFRIATSGGTNPEATHPFPVSSNVNRLRATSLVCNLGMVHNGIISGGSKKLSDTQLFIKNIASSKTVRRNLTDPSILALIEEYVGTSRLAFLTRRGEIIQMGDGWKKATTGMIYSNSGYIPVYYSYRNYGNSTTGFGYKASSPAWQADTALEEDWAYRGFLSQAEADEFDKEEIDDHDRLLFNDVELEALTKIDCLHLSSAEKSQLLEDMGITQDTTMDEIEWLDHVVPVDEDEEQLAEADAKEDETKVILLENVEEIILDSEDINSEYETSLEVDNQAKDEGDD